MPIISPSFGQSVAEALESVLESLTSALRNATEAADLKKMLAQMQPLFADLAQLLEDFTLPPPDASFLVPDGVTPKAGQVGYDDFARLVMQAAAEQWTPELEAAYGPIDDGGADGGAGGGAPGGAGEAHLAGPGVSAVARSWPAPFCRPARSRRWPIFCGRSHRSSTRNSSCGMRSI